MQSYSQALYAVESAPRSRPETADVTSLAAWVLPNFRVLIFAVALLEVLFLSQGNHRLFHDSDAGWHIRNGEAILTTGSLPRTDPFSYTRAGQPWFAWEWLSDVALGGAHRLAGLPAVAFVAAVAIALTVSASAQLALSLGGNLFLTATASVLLLGTTSIHWLARPHIFSWLIALLFLYVAERERRQATRTLYLLPCAAVLWANMHGSFLLGPAILFLYAAGEWIGGRTGRRFAEASLASLAATFINPYGWRLHDHIFGYLQNDYLMDHISEFRSFDFHSGGALYAELFLAVAVLGTVTLLRRRAFGPALLSIAMLHLSLYSARHLATAAVLLLPLSVAALTYEARDWPQLRGFLEYSDRLVTFDRRIWGVVPILIVLALTLSGIRVAEAKDGVGFDSVTFPVDAAGFLQKRGLQGRVFTKDQWGGYLIYRFAGQEKVFIDGRSDFYGKDLLETYAQVSAVKPAWEAVLNQYDVRFVLVPPDNALAAVLQLSPHWKRTYRDAVASVFERAE
jgi:hypothetical protein